MSLYNSLHGIQPTAALVLAMLGFTDTREIPRFRDAFFIERDGKFYAAIRTRTGGGNREEYKEANDRLRTVEGYVSDEDDAFDSTFALFIYNLDGKVNEKMIGVVFNEQNPKITDLRAMTDEAIARMKSGDIPAEVRETMDKIVAAVKDADNGPAVKIIET
jgi:hypothetical protein